MSRPRFLRAMRNTLIAMMSTLWILPSYACLSFLLNFCWRRHVVPEAIPKPLPSPDDVAQALLGCGAALLAATWFGWSLFLINRFLPIDKEKAH